MKLYVRKSVAPSFVRIFPGSRARIATASQRSQSASQSQTFK